MSECLESKGNTPLVNKYRSYSTDDLRGLMQSGTFFPEPFKAEFVITAATPSISVLHRGTDEYHKAVRQRINGWLKHWDFPDVRDVVMRLTSEDQQPHESALWELYLNSLFRDLGFSVIHEPLALPNGEGEKAESPDFLIEKDGVQFLVEAVTISREPTQTEKKLWTDLLSYIQKHRRDDFWIGIRPISSSSTPPKMKKILAQINTYLDSFDPSSQEEISLVDREDFRICVEGWELELHAHSMPEGEPIDVFVGMWGNLDSGVITDTSDLRSQIEFKRSKYGKDLPHRFIIAVLENSFMRGLDDVHRLGALFGDWVVNFHVDGTSTNGRKPNGIWNNGKRDAYISGLLLLAGINIGAEQIRLPEFWTNPYLDNSLHDVFPFSIWKLDGETYSKTSGLDFWNQ